MDSYAGVILRRNRLWVHGCRQTVHGVLIASRPVVSLAVDASASEIAMALREALASFRTGTEHPKDWSQHVDVIQEAMGAKSWNQWNRGALNCGVRCDCGQIVFQPDRNAGPKAGFVPLTDRNISIPEDSDDETLVNALRTALSRCE